LCPGETLVAADYGPALLYGGGVGKDEDAIVLAVSYGGSKFGFEIL
jgi:hypothetical protein